MTLPAGLNIVGLVLLSWVAQTSFGQSLNTCVSSGVTVTAYESISTTITSPNYPSDYQNSLECTWLIAIDNRLNGYIVKVTFDNLSLERIGSLCHDTLKFYDGTSAGSNLLGSYCGTTYPEVIYSTGENMYVKFRTDSSATDKGFSIKFSAVREEEASGICRPWDASYTVHSLGGSSGTFFNRDYPVPYKGNARCVWTIRVPVGKRVKLKFQDLDLKKSFYTCKSQSTNHMDFVQIGDGQDTASKELAIYCGYKRFFNGYPEVYSKGRYMWVAFYASARRNAFQTNKGFKARFEAVDLGPTVTERKLCYTGNPYNNDLKLNGSYGTLQSPQEPDYYPLGASCDWLITVPDGKIVKLSFDRFDLEPSSGSECTADYVEVLDGRYSSSRSKGKFCGYSVSPGNIRSSGRYMWVSFRADTAGRLSYDGFKATYTAEDKPTSTGLIIGIVVSVVVFIGVVCCIVCVVKRKKKPSGRSGAAIPMSTTTTTATHTTQPGVIQHPPPPPIQPSYQPPFNPYPLPPVGYAPVPTNPPPPAAPNPYPPYPLEPPPPYPGNETVPQYPPPGQSYPWLQSAPPKASTPPGSP